MAIKDIVLVAGAILAAGHASAGLIDRVGDMIYGDVLNITQVKDANQVPGSTFDNGSDTADGQMTWARAVARADQLVWGGFSDWRLPSTTTGPTSNCGRNVNLCATAGSDILLGLNAANLAMFTDVQSDVC